MALTLDPPGTVSRPDTLTASGIPGIERTVPAPADSAAAPQSLAPFLGAALLTVGGGANYDLLYLSAAALTFLGALTIIPVRKVK